MYCFRVTEMCQATHFGIISVFLSLCFLFKDILHFSPSFCIFAENSRDYDQETISAYCQAIQVLALPSAPEEALLALRQKDKLCFSGNRRDKRGVRLVHR